MRASQRWLVRYMGAIFVACAGNAAAAPAVRAAPVSHPVRVSRQGHRLTVALAPALRQALQQHFPGFTLPPLTAFAPEVLREVVPKRHARPAVPFACVGDFDGNGLPDAALLLRTPRGQWRLVAFHQTAQGTFRPYRIDLRPALPGGRADFYLTRQPRGRVEYFTRRTDEAAVLHLAHDGILLLWTEEGLAPEVFYFRKGHYRSVEQGD